MFFMLITELDLYLFMKKLLASIIYVKLIKTKTVYLNLNSHEDTARCFITSLADLNIKPFLPSRKWSYF